MLPEVPRHTPYRATAPYQGKMREAWAVRRLTLFNFAGYSKFHRRVGQLHDTPKSDSHGRLGSVWLAQGIRHVPLSRVATGKRTWKVVRCQGVICDPR